MKLKEKISDFLSSEREELTIQITELPEVFRERKKTEIEEALETEDQMKERSEEIIDQLGESLVEIKDFKDDEDLKVVEDVAQSFYNR